MSFKSDTADTSSSDSSHPALYNRGARLYPNPKITAWQDYDIPLSCLQILYQGKRGLSLMKGKGGLWADSMAFLRSMQAFGIHQKCKTIHTTVLILHSRSHSCCWSTLTSWVCCPLELWFPSSNSSCLWDSTLRSLQRKFNTVHINFPLCAPQRMMHTSLALLLLLSIGGSCGELSAGLRGWTPGPLHPPCMDPLCLQM